MKETEGLKINTPKLVVTKIDGLQPINISSSFTDSITEMTINKHRTSYSITKRLLNNSFEDVINKGLDWQVINDIPKMIIQKTEFSYYYILVK